MASMKLTKTIVEGLPFATGQQALYRDSELTGFALRVGANSKTYIVERRVNGKNIRLTIGKHGPWTAERARREAQKLLGEMANGTDPRAAQAQQSRRTMTLGQAFEDYLRTKSHLKTKTHYDYQRIMTTCFSEWQDRPLAQFTKRQVSDRHREIGEQRGPHYANLAFRMLRAVFNHVMAHDEQAHGEKLLHENPVTILSATKGWFRQSRRQDYIEDHQLGPWYQAVLGLADANARDFLLLLLFTGLRKNEGFSLRWADVDLAGRTLKIPDTKNHHPLTLPLSTQLHELLASRAQDPGSPFVFPGRGRCGHLQDVRAAIQTVTANSGVAFSLHDLRRTFITTADSLDISQYAVKRLVNHSLSQSDVTAGYIVSDVTRLREPMQRITDRILEHVRTGTGHP